MQNLLEIFVTGLILGNTICVLSSCAMSPILYISASGENIKGALKSLFVFSISRLAVYIILGAAAGISAAAIGSLVSSDRFHLVMGVVTGAVIIAAAVLIIAGDKIPQSICSFTGINRICRGSKNMAVMGVLLALVPCAPLISLISQVMLRAQGALTGALEGFLFGLGTAASLPLWLFGIFAGVAPHRIITNPAIYRFFKIACAILMTIIGLKYIIEV